MESQKVNPIISIFIPVFNGEKYIGETIKSILKQTFKQFELILVDDCSTDGSMQILRKYSDIDSRLKVISTIENMVTVGKIANYIMDEVRGEYFLYSSQDDLFSEDWLQKMHIRAVEVNADAIVPDMQFYFENGVKSKKVYRGLNGDRSRIITGKQAAIESIDWNVHGFVLWRTDMVKRIKFANFGVYDSEYTTREFYLNSKTVAFSEGVFYYRNDNPSAITKKFSPNLFDMPYQKYMLYLLFTKYGVDSVISRKFLDESLSALIRFEYLMMSCPADTSRSDIDKMNSKLEHCFNALSQKNILKILSRRANPIQTIKRIFLSGSYSNFKLACWIIVYPVSLVREKISIFIMWSKKFIRMVMHG